MKSAFIIVSFLIAATPAFAVNEVANVKEIRERLGLSKYVANSRLADVKVAILDNGFAGFQSGKGYLPASAELLNLTQFPSAGTPHGLQMAQTVWAVAERQAAGPKFYLLNTNGFSNFKAAAQFLIDNKVDIALYSQTWAFGGNFDGSGFINALVTRAAQAGTIWINAAGNNGGMVHNGPVIGPGAKNTLRLENSLDENPVTITLSWTDFTDSEEYNTSKDLDLFVRDEAGNVVASSELIQRGEAPPAGSTDSKLSSHARETVTLSLDRGKYRIEIKAKSQNFAATDKLRVLVKSEKPGLTFVDRTSGGEIMPPADNALAITVGDFSPESAQGPTADGRAKPETVIADSSVEFTNGSAYAGTSNAAALFAGAVALMKAEAPRLTTTALRNYIARLPNAQSAYEDLESAELLPISKSVMELLQQSGQGAKLAVQKQTQRLVLLTPIDPSEHPAVKRAGVSATTGQLLLFNSKTSEWIVVPASDAGLFKAPYVELRRKLGGSGKLWKTPAPSELPTLVK